MKMSVKNIVFIILISLMLLQSGCQSDRAIGNNEEHKLNITMAGGSPSGMLYMVLSGVAECVHRSYPGSTVMIVPGSGTGNLFRINNNEVDVGASHSATAYSALKGEDCFENELGNIASIASLYPSTLQIVVKQEMGIGSFDQIINNQMKIRLSIDQPGSTSSITFQRLLAEYGVSEEDFVNWGGEIIYKNMGDSANMLVDGRVDGMSISTFFPAPTILESSQNKKLTMLEIDPLVIERMIEKYHYNKITIPADTYNFLHRDLSAIASSTIIVVPANAPEDTAYKLACAISENITYMHDVHASLSQLTPQSLIENLGIPIHKGAERYYREIGIIK